jgi:hypothetical protein
MGKFDENAHMPECGTDKESHDVKRLLFSGSNTGKTVKMPIECPRPGTACLSVGVRVIIP